MQEKNRLRRIPIKKVSCFKRNSHCLSSIIGTILILSISISLLTVVYFVVFQVSDQYNTAPTPTVNIVGTVEEKKIILINRGGAALSSDTEVVYTILGTSKPYTISHQDIVFDDATGDGWTIGEQVIYTHTESLEGFEIKVMVLDAVSKTILMSGVLQEGIQGVTPFCRTLSNCSVGSYEAIIKMDYDFYEQTGSKTCWFTWKKASDPDWSTTAPQSISGSKGFYQKTIPETGSLEPNTRYLYRAFIQYQSESEPFESKTVAAKQTITFTTFGDKVAEWRFEASDSGSLIYDSSGSENHGYLQPDIPHGPVHMDMGLGHETALFSEGVDDYVSVPSAPSLSLTQAMSVDAWVKPDEVIIPHRAHTTSTFIVNNLAIFGAMYYDCINPDILRVPDTNFYIIASENYNTSSPQGYLVTVEIHDNGDIKYVDAGDTSCIKSLFSFTTKCFNTKIIHIKTIASVGNIFAVVYKGTNNYGYIETVLVSDDGSISQPAEYTFNAYCFSDSTLCNNPAIIKIVGSMNKYAIVFSSTSSYAKMVTLSISTDGINPGIVSYVSGFSGTDNQKITIQPKIIFIEDSGTEYRYAIVFKTFQNDGGIRSLKIQPDGAVSDISDMTYFDTTEGSFPDIIHVSGSVYAIVYGGQYGGLDGHINGRLKTIDISPAGGITVTWDTDRNIIIENSDTIFLSPVIIKVGSDATYSYFAIVYHRAWNILLKTYKIKNSNGIITSTASGSVYLHSNGVATTPGIVLTSGQIFTCVYRSNGDGILKTLQINNDGTIDNAVNLPVIDTTQIGIPNCYEPTMLLVQEFEEYSIFAISYRNEEYRGFLSTVSISHSGSLGSMQFLKTMVFDQGILSDKSNQNSKALFPQFIHVENDIFSVVYCGSSYKLHVKTYSISSDGLTIVYKNTYDSVYKAYHTSITRVAGNIFAIAFRGYSSGYDGRVLTLQIDAATGEITYKDHFRFEGIGPGNFGILWPHIIPVSDDYFVVAYENGSTNTTVVTTIQINSGGTITKNIVSTLVLENPNKIYNENFPQILPVHGSNSRIYAVLYTGPNNKSIVKTISISLEGIISSSIIDIQILDNNKALYNHIIYLGERNYAVVYEQLNNKGYICTFRIAENGHISNPVSFTDEKVQFDSRYIQSRIYIVPVKDDVFALVYCANYYRDLYIKTVKIDLIQYPAILLEKQYSFWLYFEPQPDDSLVLTYLVSCLNEETGLIEVFSVTSPIASDTWSHIQASFSTSGEIKLKINDGDVLTTTTPYPYVNDDSELKFGECNAYYDDIIIYSRDILS